MNGSLSVMLVLALLLGPVGPALAAPAPHTSSSTPVVQVHSRVGRTQHVQPRTVPDGLSAGDWASIQDQVAAGPCRSDVDGGGRCHIHYGADGVTRLTRAPGQLGRGSGV